MANSATKSSLCCLCCPSGFQEHWLPGHEALCAWGSSSWDGVWQSTSCSVCQALSSVLCSALPRIVRLSLDPDYCRNMWGCPGKGRKTSTHPRAALRTCRTKLLQQHRGSRAQPGTTAPAVAAWKRRRMWGLSPESILLPAAFWVRTGKAEEDHLHLLFPPLSLGFFYREGR